MRRTTGLTLLYAALRASGAFAQSVNDMITAVPQCALPCVVKGILGGNCPMTNITLLEDCVCTNNTVLAGLSNCVQTSCQFSDQITSGDLLMSMCAAYPKESRVNEVRTVALVALILSSTVVAARCTARLQLTGRLWSDDWTAIFATIILLGGAGLELASANLGFGLHFWDVYVTKAARLLQMFYTVEIFYTWVKLIAKASVIFLYMRVFPARWFRLACYACLSYCCISLMIFTFVVAFQCTPVEAIWNRFVVGKCLNVNAIGYSGAVLSVVEDLVLILLPIPELRKLQISGRKRVGVGLMFALASFAMITSMIRLKYLVQFSKTLDSTFDNVDAIVWSMIELTCIIVCGSLPPLRPWFGKLIPSIETIKSVSWPGARSRSKSNPSNPRYDESTDKRQSHGVSEDKESNTTTSDEYPLKPLDHRSMWSEP
ncbi:putative Extracellular membrane protein CFEM domain-containing protein [Seiridium cardinale]